MEAAIKSEPGRKMTLDQLAQTVEFRQLRTQKMAKWVLAYIQSYLDTGIFDVRAATKIAYGHSNENTARRYGPYLRKHLKVKAVVQMFLNFGKSEIELDLEEIQRHLDACAPGSVAAQRLLLRKHSLKSQLKRIRESEPEPEAVTIVPAPAPAPETPARFHIGDIAVQDGKKFRVTSIDANGQPLTADEVE